METNKLYDLADKNNIKIINFKLRHTKSTSVTDGEQCCIGIDEKAIETQSELRVHMAHELGHCMTGSFYNVYSPIDQRGKHEYRADKWAVTNLIDKELFIEQLKKGLTQWELAEFFDVTEELIIKAHHYYCELEIIN